MTSLYETVLFKNVASSKQFSVQDHCFVLCVGNNSVQNIDQKNKNGKDLEPVRTVHLAEIYKI
jgi:hypothetical protein